MPNEAAEVLEGRQVQSLEATASTVALLNKSEIDQQITTARHYPRSIKGFRDEVLALATLNESAAEECSYAVPRDGKTVIGPSARFAEIVASAWGNCRAGARVVDDRGEFVVAQGAFMDLQKNVAITYEVQRRVVEKNGRRYKPDMIGVTANAACSIALRNAILKGVPKALWSDLWEQARRVAVGDVTTLANKRAKLLERLQAFGVTEAQVMAKLGRAAVEDITLADIEILLGLGTAIKEGEVTPEEAFATGPTPVAEASTTKIDSVKAAIRTAKPKAKQEPTKAEFTFADVASEIAAALAAKSVEQLDLAADLIRQVKDEKHRAELAEQVAQARADIAKPEKS